MMIRSELHEKKRVRTCALRFQGHAVVQSKLLLDVIRVLIKIQDT